MQKFKKKKDDWRNEMLLFKYGKFKIKIYSKRTLKELWRYIIYKLFHDRRAEAGGKDIKIPDHELEALARAILPDIISFFENEKGKSEFENWRKEQEVIKQKIKVG